MPIIYNLWHFTVYCFIGTVNGLTVNWKDGPSDERPFGKAVRRTNMHWYKWPTGKYLVVQMASGSNGKFHKTVSCFKRTIGKMATWTNDRLEKWPVIQMSVGTNGSPANI